MSIDNGLIRHVITIQCVLLMKIISLIANIDHTLDCLCVCKRIAMCIYLSVPVVSECVSLRLYLVLSLTIK